MLHRALVVRDHDEVAPVEEPVQARGEPLGVGLVERRIDFVEDAEGGGLALEDGQEQRHRGHALLAARELADHAGLLAGRLRTDLDAAGEPIHVALLVGHEEHVRAAAAEEPAEHAVRAAEVGPDRVEGLLEADPADAVELAHEHFELRLGLVDVGQLRAEVVEPRLEQRELVDRVEVDVAQAADLIAQDVGLGARLHPVGNDEETRLALREVRLVPGAEVECQFLEGRGHQVLDLDRRLAPRELGRVPLALGLVARLALGAQRLGRPLVGDGGLREPLRDRHERRRSGAFLHERRVTVGLGRTDRGGELVELAVPARVLVLERGPPRTEVIDRTAQDAALAAGRVEHGLGL